MPRNYRFHAIAIAIISVVIIGVYFITKPKPVAAVADQPLLGDRYIQVYGATWGEECNPYIDANAANTPMKKDDKGMLIAPTLPQRVELDNVLPVISDACNGKLTCTMPINSKSMGVEPMESCFKQLKVSYRCYAYDRLWNVTVRQGEKLTIDCNDPDLKPKQ
ncbi:MAG: hypothetical protein ACKVOE_03890 [Rickettsiales bacterium]